MKDKTHSRRRGSTRMVIDRCLTLLLRLMQSETTTQEMLEIVKQKVIADDENLSYSALKRRLEEDRDRLKEWFGCVWDYDRRTDTYTLTAIERPLLDLTPEALRGLAFLQSTFSGDTVPMGQEVRALMNSLQMVLPKVRLKELNRERRFLDIKLQTRDSDTISDEVQDILQQACSEHRQLEFDYYSPQQTDGQPRRHRVEPLRYYYDTVRTHYYLEAYWIESFGPKGPHPHEMMLSFRVGRIRNPRILPTHFRPGGRPVRKHELIYELAPEVARLGVTKHFPDSVIKPYEDGSATVHAQSSNLFIDLRTLLYYGPNCRVIGGKEAVNQMKEIVGQMYQRYQKES